MAIYTALAHNHAGLRAKVTARTEESAARKAVNAAKWDVNEINVYLRMKDGHDAWVAIYGRDTLDALTSAMRRGRA